LNFDAFGTFSPLRIRSAPTFFPSLGQPYFGPKRLQDEDVRRMRQMEERGNMVLGTFMDRYLNVFKPTNIILHLQVSVRVFTESGKTDPKCRNS